jgi:hypothetical protein
MLTAAERQQLQGLIATDKGAAQKLIHARIPPKAAAAEGGPAGDDQRGAEAGRPGQGPLDCPGLLLTVRRPPALGPDALG